MRRSEAIRIARQMDRHILRQWELGQIIRDAAEGGDAVARVAAEAIHGEGLPHPLTEVENVVRNAVGLPREGE